MFTTRAEFLLLLRIDNAAERLTEIGYGLDCTIESWQRIQRKKMQKGAIVDWLNTMRPDSKLCERLGLSWDDRPTLAQWLRRPEASIAMLRPEIEAKLEEAALTGVLATVETEIKYAGYIAQQGRQIQKLKDAERRPIPYTFAYHQVPGLSREIQEKLLRVQPETLGQAGRIPGVTPAAIAVLDVYLTVTKGAPPQVT